MARISKIAKLPPSIREDLNQRLERAESGRSILEWLNAVPEVQELLKLHFNSEPVSEQNITNWRHSGFAAWKLREDFLTRLELFSDEKLDLDSLTLNFADHAARLLSIHFALLLSPSSQAILSSSSSKASRTRSKSTKSTLSTESTPSSFFSGMSNEQSAIFLVKLTRAVVSLRRSDFHAARLKLLLDKSRATPPAKKQFTPEQESMAREIAAIRSRRPVIEPLDPSPTPAPAPLSPSPDSNSKTKPAPAPDPQPPSAAPRTERRTPSPPYTSPTSPDFFPDLKLNQDISSYSNPRSYPYPPPGDPPTRQHPTLPFINIRADIGDLTPEFARWLVYSEPIETVRERYLDREHYLPADVQAALKAPTKTTPLK